MKRVYLAAAVTALSLSALCVFAGGSSLTSALRDCSSYSQYGIVDTEGMKVESRKQILGWENDKCVYQEHVKFSGVSSDITCRFTQAQITEISSVMNAYELLQGYSAGDVDTSSVSAVQKNPVVKVWGKYLQDSSVCTVSIEQTGPKM